NRVIVNALTGRLTTAHKFLPKQVRACIRKTAVMFPRLGSSSSPRMFSAVTKTQDRLDNDINNGPNPWQKELAKTVWIPKTTTAITKTTLVTIKTCKRGICFTSLVD
ncbi:MAG: hypothetical protein M1318_02125, partial [Firmicutes bacterium]|nr:hypothetical protein [Bacillota bacterium]